MTTEFEKALTKLDAARTNAEWNEARARVVALYEAARTEAFRQAASACKDVFDQNVDGRNDWVRGQATGANTCMTAIWELAGKPK